MGSNQNHEIIYQLIEQFDFNELSAEDKLFVLSHLSESEYQNMRETIKDSKKYFTDNPEMMPDASIYKSLTRADKHKNVVVRTLNYSMQLYKVAVTILIILGITFLLFYKSNPGLYKQMLVHDTIYINKTDTVYSLLRDTIQIVKTLFVNIPQKSGTAQGRKLLAGNTVKNDCSKEICPSDVDRITHMVSSNNIAQDTFLSDFVVAIK
jgi:hypothetical protein